MYLTLINILGSIAFTHHIKIRAVKNTPSWLIAFPTKKWLIICNHNPQSRIRWLYRIGFRQKLSKSSRHFLNASTMSTIYNPYNPYITHINHLGTVLAPERASLAPDSQHSQHPAPGKTWPAVKSKPRWCPRYPQVVSQVRSCILQAKMVVLMEFEWEFVKETEFIA